MRGPRREAGHCHRRTAAVMQNCPDLGLKVFLPGQFFPHYYQLLLVPLALGAGLALDQMSGVSINRRTPLWNAAALAALLVLVGHEWPLWQLSPEQLSNYKYGPEFVDAHDDALAVGALLRPGEGLYLYSGEPEYYFWTKKSPPSGMVSNMLNETPNVPVLTGRTLASLRRDPPQLVIVDDSFPVTPIADFIRAHYVVVRRNGFLTYLALDHGSLLERLERGE